MSAVRVERFDPAADAGHVQACFEIYRAAHPVDEPDGPVMSRPVFGGWFASGWRSASRVAAMAVRDDGRPAGAYLLELPDRDNTQMGGLQILVPPGRRRAGTGTALLRHAAGQAAAHGRTRLAGETRVGAAGSAFAAAMGATPEILDVRRVLDVTGIPPGKLARLRAGAGQAARGYSLISWSGPTPDEYISQVAAVLAAIADAPRAAGTDAPNMGEEQIRQNDQRSAEQGVRIHTVAARCDETAELAGMTQLGVDPEDPAWGLQFYTAVTRAHRGHRLGMLLKVALLDLLPGTEPGVRRIQTFNAGANQHMIGINEALGFTILDEWQTWHLDVAAAR